MSDGDVEVPTPAAEAPAEVGTAAAAVAPREPMDVMTALQEVLKNALVADGLRRGIRESVKALDKRQAHLAVLSSSCDEPNYVKLIEGLCAEHSIPLIKMDDGKKLGEWAGLCKIDKEGAARKVVGASSVVVTDIGKEGEAWDVLCEYFKGGKQE